MTLLELVVAATVTAVLLTLAGPAWRTVVFETKLVERRAAVVSELQVARAFLVSDAVAAGRPVACADGAVPSLPMGSIDGVPAVVEYRRHDGGLYRWSWPPGEETLVAREIASLSCSSAGPDLLTVEIGGGAEPYPARLVVQLTALPPAAPPAAP